MEVSRSSCCVGCVRVFGNDVNVTPSPQVSQESMSDLEGGMAAIIRVFHQYSGHKCKLRKAELKELINNEMSHFIKVEWGGGKGGHVHVWNRTRGEAEIQKLQNIFASECLLMFTGTEVFLFD